MTETITYIAWDETGFDTKEECIAYEENQRNVFLELHNNVKLFDKKGNEITWTIVNDLETTADNWEQAYNETEYYIVVKKITVPDIQDILGAIGIAMPLSTKAIYKYNANTANWDYFSKAILSNILQLTSEN